MIPDSLKQRYQSQVRPQLDRASVEFRKILKDLGVSVNEKRSLKDVISQIRAKNPTFRDLNLNLDMATYDLRKKLWWDANMLTAYAYDKAEKTYETGVAPRFSQARARAESQARNLFGARRIFDQLRELGSRKSVETAVPDKQ